MIKNYDYVKSELQKHKSEINEFDQIIKIIEGIAGEQKVRKYIHDAGFNYFQVDLIIKHKGIYLLAEIKHQEMFKAPPFDGHGLPKWQVLARIEFQKITNIRACLFIVDKETNVLYFQYLDELEKGKKHYTNGKSPRVVYPLESFKNKGILED